MRPPSEKKNASARPSAAAHVGVQNCCVNVAGLALRWKALALPQLASVGCNLWPSHTHAWAYTRRARPHAPLAKMHPTSWPVCQLWPARMDCRRMRPPCPPMPPYAPLCPHQGRGFSCTRGQAEFPKVVFSLKGNVPESGFHRNALDSPVPSSHRLPRPLSLPIARPLVRPIACPLAPPLALPLAPSRGTVTSRGLGMQGGKPPNQPASLPSKVSTRLLGTHRLSGLPLEDPQPTVACTSLARTRTQPARGRVPIQTSLMQPGRASLPS